MRVASINLGRGVDAAEFRANVLRIRRRLPGALLCFQEIDEADAPDEHAIIDDVLGDRWAFAGWDTHTPIAVPKRIWEIVDEDLVYASPGVPRQTPTRRHVVAVLQHRYRPDVRIAAVNAHAPRNDERLEAERVQWAQALRETVHDIVDDGLSAVLTMDRNGAQPPQLHRRQVVVAKSRPDFVLWVPAPRGVQARVLGSREVPLTIDAHDALVGRLRLSAAA